MDFFWANYIFFELKKCRGVIFHETEEGYKIWRGIVSKLTLGICQILTWALEISKFFTLMGSFWAKCILLELKKYRGVIFHDIEEWYQILRKTDLSFGNDMRNLANFHRSTRKCQNWNFNEFLLSNVENVRA